MDRTTSGDREIARRNATTLQFVGFELAGQKYAFHIEQIQEILIPAAVTRIPEVPAYVEGVSNLRGTIIPIIGLRQLFGLDPAAPDDQTRTVVVNVGARTMGCTVDAVSRVLRITTDQIQAAGETVMAAGRRYIEGFARVGDDVYIVLDVVHLLDPSRLDEVHQASVRGAGVDFKADLKTAAEGH
jgi:purine-binding chemotaxis protein CheW